MAGRPSRSPEKSSSRPYLSFHDFLVSRTESLYYLVICKVYSNSGSVKFYKRQKLYHNTVKKINRLNSKNSSLSRTESLYYLGTCTKIPSLPKLTDVQKNIPPDVTNIWQSFKEDLMTVEHLMICRKTFRNRGGCKDSSHA